MKINKTNFCEYAFQYLEGEMDQAQKAEFMSFIAENQEFEYEFEQIKNTYLQPEVNIASPDLNHIKKNYSDVSSIDESNIDEFCIAFLENDLDLQSTVKFKQAIKQNGQFEKTLNLYRKIKLLPDTTISLSVKDSLKKKQKKHAGIQRKYIIAVMTAAASIMILIYTGIKLFSPDVPIQNTPEIASESITSHIDKPSVTVADIIPETSSGVKKKVHSNTSIVHTTGPSEPKREHIELAPLQPVEVAYFTEPGIVVNLESSHFQMNRVASVNSGRMGLQNRNRIFQLTNMTYEDLDVISALQYGLKGFNQLTESDVELYAQKNENGKINRITLNADNFRLTRSLRKK